VYCTVMNMKACKFWDQAIYSGRRRFCISRLLLLFLFLLVPKFHRFTRLLRAETCHLTAVLQIFVFLCQVALNRDCEGYGFCFSWCCYVSQIFLYVCFGRFRSKMQFRLF